MKEYIKIKIASPVKVLQWTERSLPDGKLTGEIKKSMTLKICKLEYNTKKTLIKFLF